MASSYSHYFFLTFCYLFLLLLSYITYCKLINTLASLNDALSFCKHFLRGLWLIAESEELDECHFCWMN